jgi:GNAT superfamily N-acetyltransferase
MLDKQSLTHEASIGVTYSSLMSAVSLFFTGILISQYASFGPTIKIPLAFLIISTFSFIFSATIYMNAGPEIALNKLQAVEKYMVYGKNIMELLGLYLFVMATPLVIGAITNDSYLRLMTVAVTIISFGLYSQSRFSIFEKELTILRKRLLSLLIVSIMVLLYSLQNARLTNALEFYAGIAMLLLLVLTFCAYYFSTRSKQYKQARFRPFTAEDAPTLSALIGKNLAKAKLGREGLQSLKELYSPDGLLAAAQKHQFIVAEFNDKQAGLAVLSKHEITAVFTDTSLHRKGIGRMLVEQAEAEAIRQGLGYTQVAATKIDHGFYKRLGYKETGKTSTSPAGTPTIIMRKELQP